MDRPVNGQITAQPREQTRARYPDECGYAERDGVRVYYEAYGKGEPTILFLPTWESSTPGPGSSRFPTSPAMAG
jgi:hypothetical protein